MKMIPFITLHPNRNVNQIKTNLQKGVKRKIYPPNPALLSSGRAMPNPCRLKTVRDSTSHHMQIQVVCLIGTRSQQSLGFGCGVKPRLGLLCPLGSLRQVEGWLSGSKDIKPHFAWGQGWWWGFMWNFAQVNEFQVGCKPTCSIGESLCLWGDGLRAAVKLDCIDFCPRTPPNKTFWPWKNREDVWLENALIATQKK